VSGAEDASGQDYAKGGGARAGKVTQKLQKSQPATRGRSEGTRRPQRAVAGGAQNQTPAALLNELPADAQAVNAAMRKRASVAKRSNDRLQTNQSPKRGGDYHQDDDAQRQGSYARARPQLRSQAQPARQLTKQGLAKQLDEEAYQQTSLAIYSTH